MLQKMGQFGALCHIRRHGACNVAYKFGDSTVASARRCKPCLSLELMAIKFWSSNRHLIPQGPSLSDELKLKDANDGASKTLGRDMMLRSIVISGTPRLCACRLYFLTKAPHKPLGLPTDSSRWLPNTRSTFWGGPDFSLKASL